MIIEVTRAWDEAWVAATHAVVVALDDVQFCRAHAYDTSDPDMAHPVTAGTYVKVAGMRAGGPRLVLRATAGFDVVAAVGARGVEALGTGRGVDHAVSVVARRLVAEGLAEPVGLVDDLDGEYHPLEDVVAGIEALVADMEVNLAHVRGG